MFSLLLLILGVRDHRRSLSPSLHTYLQLLLLLARTNNI